MRISRFPRFSRPAAAAAALSVALAGCSVRRVAELLVPDGHFSVARDIAYGPAPRQRLDVYRPREARGPTPVVVFLYGGRWQEGSKDLYRLLGNALTRRGWLVVVPDYRLYPAVRFPAFVEDAARAVRWARDHAARLGGDTTRIFVVGHSAGAHSATLLALDERYLRAAGVPPGSIAGYVSLAGPVDTAWTDADVQALMGGTPEAWERSYPRNYIDGTEPPLLLLHGAKDRTVAPANSTRLAERIRARGGCARAIVYPGVDHLKIIYAVAAPWLGIAPVLDDVERFIRQPRSACAAATR